MLKYNTSIRSKITILLMVTSTLAVLLTSLIFHVIISSHLAEQYKNSLEDLATIVGENCTASLLFKIPEDAVSTLNSLQSRKSILSVQLYDKDHNLFASYFNEDRNKLLTDIKSSSASTNPAHLHIRKEIVLEDGSAAGTIVIIDDMREIIQTQKNILNILIFVAAFAIFSSYLLTSFLRNIISRPLSNLTVVAERIAQGDFSAIDSVVVQSSDEIGTLSSSFIDMGNKLHRSHQALEKHSQDLESRVSERTKQLEKAVNDLKKSQAQLIQSEKLAALGILVAGIAHDINNNINFISSIIPSVTRLTQDLVNLKQDNWQTDTDSDRAHRLQSEIKTLLKSADEGVRRTSQIVNDLSTFSRPSEGTLSPVNVQQEIESILRFLHGQFSDRITIVKEFQKDLPDLFCLPDQINQVYMNILLNATQAIKDQGSIHIKTWLADEMIYIRFRDDGCGISKEVLPKVYDPFFTTKKVGQGSGLGMSISYSIIQNHHGEITIESTGEKGTDVLLRLPCSGVIS